MIELMKVWNVNEDRQIGLGWNDGDQISAGQPYPHVRRAETIDDASTVFRLLDFLYDIMIIQFLLVACLEYVMLRDSD